MSTHPPTRRRVRASSELWMTTYVLFAIDEGELCALAYLTLLAISVSPDGASKPAARRPSVSVPSAIILRLFPSLWTSADALTLPDT